MTDTSSTKHTQYTNNHRHIKAGILDIPAKAPWCDPQAIPSDPMALRRERRCDLSPVLTAAARAASELSPHFVTTASVEDGRPVKWEL